MSHKRRYVKIDRKYLHSGGCTISGRKKAGFSSRLAALQIMNMDDRLQGVYKCPHCNKWHVTKQKQ